jgi:1-acyl-sn-glycerol-3-phosphate acyltransferase
MEGRGMKQMKKMIARLVLWLGGWENDGKPPSAPRCVLIAFPHTSNWDFIWTLAFAWAMDVEISWMGKEEMFRWPFGSFMRALGGVPVHRKSRANQVDQLAERLRSAQRLTLVVPAEGTRHWVPRWKSGFYHIARAAQVPIVLGFLDYSRKVGGFGPAIRVTGDVGRDMDVIRAFYAPMRGKYHECTGTIVLAEELAQPPAVA